jgi:hypothetical protein
MADHSDHYDACLRGANAALDAFRRGGAGGPVLRKLTLYKARSCNCYRRSIVSFVLAHPAAARLEELCVDYKESTMYRDAVQLAALSCAATLRVLEIAYCDIKMAPSASAARRAFPRLTSLVLRNCVLPEGNLQDVVDAAPQLASLHLQEVLHEMADVDPKVTYDGGPPRCLLRFRLRAPTVTALIISVCHGNGYGIRGKSAIPDNGIDLDMPNLQILRYRGRRVRLTMKQPMPRLALVELDDHGRGGERELQLL